MYLVLHTSILLIQCSFIFNWFVQSTAQPLALSVMSQLSLIVSSRDWCVGFFPYTSVCWRNPTPFLMGHGLWWLWSGYCTVTIGRSSPFLSLYSLLLCHQTHGLYISHVCGYVQSISDYKGFRFAMTSPPLLLVLVVFELVKLEYCHLKNIFFLTFCLPFYNAAHIWVLTLPYGQPVPSLEHLLLLLITCVSYDSHQSEWGSTVSVLSLSDWGIPSSYTLLGCPHNPFLLLFYVPGVILSSNVGWNSVVWQ